MANERTLWNYLRKGMQPYWRPQRIEDKLSHGIPDVCYALPGVEGFGFVELKWARAWPKRATTPLRLPHFTKVQKAWLRRFGDYAYRVYLLLQVEKDYMLFDYVQAQRLGEITREQILAGGCDEHWEKRIDFEELAARLR